MGRIISSRYNKRMRLGPIITLLLRHSVRTGSIDKALKERQRKEREGVIGRNKEEGETAG